MDGKQLATGVLMCAVCGLPVLERLHDHGREHDVSVRVVPSQPLRDLHTEASTDKIVEPIVAAISSSSASAAAWMNPPEAIRRKNTDYGFVQRTPAVLFTVSSSSAS